MCFFKRKQLNIKTLQHTHQLNQRMKAFKYIFFLLLIALIGISIYIAVQPNTLEVSRTRTVKAPVAVVYDNIIDFKNWEAWSSWIADKPNMKTTFAHQTKGVGGSYAWEDQDGIGTIKTVETIPNALISQKMQIAGFPASEINWIFKPNSNGTTQVSWTISAKDLPFSFKAYTIFKGNIEKQIAAYFERSIKKLESHLIAEMIKYSITINGETNRSGGYYLYTTASSKISELQNKIQEMLPKLMAYAEKNNIAPAGAPFVNYIKWDDENNAAIFSCCIPTTERIITVEGDEVLTGEFESFKAIKTTVKGNYSHLAEAWNKTRKYIPENGFEVVENGPMLETYLNKPENTPNPADLITEIYMAVKDTLH